MQACAEGRARKAWAGLADAGRVAGEIDTVHQERGAGLAAEFGLDASDGTGHEPQRKPGHVAWRASAPGGCLDRGGELVKGEVAGAADLEDAARGRRHAAFTTDFDYRSGPERAASPGRHG